MGRPKGPRKSRKNKLESDKAMNFDLVCFQNKAYNKRKEKVGKKKSFNVASVVTERWRIFDMPAYIISAMGGCKYGPPLYSFI